ncbi:MAG: hypothetical protein H0X41_00200 [Chitinophagaceae bacterium]|nr:hypothetical protein [Chitinophagaceae bacterium]
MCIKKDILATLAYFDLFSYPLKKREIFIFLPQRDKRPQFDQALTALVNVSMIFRLGEFYSLRDNYALAERRRWGNDRAIKMLKNAEKAAKVIASFPFVRGVAISGSLSKKFADKNADIDFFIITAANRLWLSRTLLHMFKKLTYLFNRQHHYCMNYFIDEAELVILEKNIYTATEVATILPIYDTGIFAKFYKANTWADFFLPNNYMHITSAKEINNNPIKSIIERILDNRAGNQIDNLFKYLTAWSWRKKTHKKVKNMKGLLMSLHAGKHFAKPDPLNFQRKLLQRYEMLLTEVWARYEQGSSMVKEFLNKDSFLSE